MNHHDDVKGKGVDLIACVSVNDAFVMEAWGRDIGVGDKVLMIADGNAEFTTALGLNLDRANIGFGTRSMRYSMIVRGSCLLFLPLRHQIKVSHFGGRLRKMARCPPSMWRSPESSRSAPRSAY